MSFKAQIFGPGFPSAGAHVDVEANPSGIRVETAELADGMPRWSAMQMAKTGWDGAQLRMEWQGAAGTYSLAVSDKQTIAALSKFSSGKSTIQSVKPDAATRTVTHTLIWVSLLLPVLLLAAIFWQHQSIAAWAVSHISVEQESKLGEIIFSQHKNSLKPVEGAPLEMVRDIGARLTRDSRYKFQFFVTDDKSVNAFAMPGGYVVVHTGLMLLAGTPEEVAGVLAHEVQHVEERHILRGIAQSLGLYAALSLLIGDMSGLASLGGDLLKLKFSRDHETEADREGLKALVAAKIDPTGMRDFFAKMAAQSKLDLGFLSTHPASDERIADIDRLIKALPEEARQVKKIDIDYAAIKALIAPRK
ncbi:MAG: M48 family metallopeptidase [Burkholderiales bacterium]